MLLDFISRIQDVWVFETAWSRENLRVSPYSNNISHLHVGNRFSYERSIFAVYEVFPLELRNDRNVFFVFQILLLRLVLWQFLKDYLVYLKEKSSPLHYLVYPEFIVSPDTNLISNIGFSEDDEEQYHIRRDELLGMKVNLDLFKTYYSRKLVDLVSNLRINNAHFVYLYRQLLFFCLHSFLFNIYLYQYFLFLT